MGEQESQMRLLHPMSFWDKPARLLWDRHARNNRADIFSLVPSSRKKRDLEKKLILELHEKHPKFISKDNGRNDLICWF